MFSLYDMSWVPPGTRFAGFGRSNTLCMFCSSFRFKGIRESFKKNVDAWKAYYDSTQPQVEKLPGEWNESLGMFQKLIIVRCLRPDKVQSRLCIASIFIIGEFHRITNPFELQ